MTVSVLADFATQNAENVVVHTVLYSCCFYALASKMASWQNPTNIHASCMPFPGLVLYMLFLSWHVSHDKIYICYNNSCWFFFFLFLFCQTLIGLPWTWVPLRKVESATYINVREEGQRCTSELCLNQQTCKKNGRDNFQPTIANVCFQITKVPNLEQYDQGKREHSPNIEKTSFGMC